MKSPWEGVRPEYFDFLLRLGDDRLVLGHRLSEWCGHAPILEEDIALANIALDCLGQAAALLRLAGEVEGEGRSEDDLTYFREGIDFRNSLLVEQPRGDFAFTMARQFLHDAFAHHHYRELAGSRDPQLAAIAAKALKEIVYHLRHSREWMLRLGGGTDESRRRVQTAVEELWRFTGEMFEMDDAEKTLLERGLAADRGRVGPVWRQAVESVFQEAGLETPAPGQHMVSGGREGRHTEHLGHLLAQLQIVARSFPGANW